MSLAEDARATRWRSFAAVALTATPWLNPLAGGPSPTVQPWLVSMACGLGLCVLWGAPVIRVNRALLFGCAALVLWSVASQMSLRPDVLALAGGLVLILLGSIAAGRPQLAVSLQAGLLLAAGVSAVFGLLQYFGPSEHLTPWISPAETGQAYANLRQPNQYSTLCWFGVAVVLWGTLRLSAPARVVLVMLLAVGSAASVSRTALLQGLVLAVLAAFWRGPGRWGRLMLCALAAGAYVAAAISLPILLEAATGAAPERTLWARLGAGEGCSSRRVLWANVVHLITLKPLSGWGWGELDYAHFSTLYTGPRFCDILDNAHNLPLHLAVELGIPAALMTCGAFSLWMWRQRPWSEQVAVRQLAWTIVALTLLHSLLEYPLWYGPFQIALGIGIGWLAPRTVANAEASRAWVGATCGVLALCTAYATWDYSRVSQIYLPPEERRPAWQDNTLEHVGRSWLFAPQAQFAELTLETPTRANAAWMNRLAWQTLHYSPEPRVIERAIESAVFLGREEEAVWLLARYRAAFPLDHAKWREHWKSRRSSVGGP